MPRFIKWLLPSFALLLSLLFAQVTQAQTITAASCNSSDVLVALNSVTVDGTTVIIPAGTCTWTTRVAYAQVHSVTIKGAGNPTGSSSDGLNNPTGYNDQTIIQDAVAHTGNPNQTFHVTTASGKFFRITGISFLTSASQTSVPSNGIVGISGTSHSVRFDHNHVVPSLAGGSKGLELDGGTFGVVDHNYFEITSGAIGNLIEVNGYGWNGANDSGHASWADVSYAGGQQTMFVENNGFNGGVPNGGRAFDCEDGGRAVFRYNSFVNAVLQQHGVGHNAGGTQRGCRTIEIYGNNATEVGGTFSFWVMLESGGGLWWNNTVSGFQSLLYGDTVRTNNATYAQTAPPNGWGYCGTSVSGVTSSWDQNLSNDGHACIDGIGMGKGDLLSGSSFPGLANNALGGQRWPRQVAEPVYSWGNTVSGLTGSYWTNNGGIDNTTTENRDYYLELPRFGNSAMFNGTVGVGCGPASGVGCANPVPQPTTCTPGVGYWKPADSTLYQCAPGNVWNAYYTPYTYPHPLVSSSNLTWGNMDAWLQMNTSTPGTMLTPAILAAGTNPGSPLTWAAMTPATPAGYSVDVSQCSMGGSIVIGGRSYPVGTTTQSLALAGSDNFTYGTVQSFPNGVSQLVVNGCVTFGAANMGISATNEDLVVIYDGSGHFAAFQFNPGNADGTSSQYGVRIETDGSGIIRSANTTLTPGNKYYFSFLFDAVGGTSKLVLFDTVTLAQVGTTMTVQQITGGTVAKIYIGNAEIGIHTGSLHFENLMFDWTNHIFPNFPQSGGGTSGAPAPPTNLAASVQ